MQLMQSGDRIFFAEGQPIQVYDRHEKRILVYPHGTEGLYVEKGLRPSQIARHCLEGKLDRNSYMGNRFQISEGEVEFDVKQMRRPGILIRYADSASSPQKEEDKRVRGVDGAIDEVAEMFQVGEHLWDTTNLSLIMQPALYFVFSSRNYITLHRKPLFSKPGGTQLEKEVKRLFREFLTNDENLVFETLTEHELAHSSPDLVLLDNALRAGIEVGISEYAHTATTMKKYIVERLKESTGEVRRQFERKISRYRQLVGAFRPLWILLKGIGIKC